MARFEIVEGAPGQGKSLYTARQALRLLKRNKKWFERSGKKRRLASNMKFSEEFERQNEGWIVYWASLDELVKLSDCDVLWDEIATELDARNWPLLSSETKRFLSQYRKRGIDIYANTQDFSMVDVRARLMITGVKTLNKIIGSPDLSTTKPPPKVVWGLVLIRTVENYKQVNPEKKKYALFDFSFMLIEKELTDIYDTRQDIRAGALPLLRHEDRYCEYYETPGHPCYKKSHKVLHL